MPGLSRGVLFAGFVVTASMACRGRQDKLDERALADVLSAVFTRGVAQPETIPDRGVLKAPGVLVREELGSTGTRVPQAALNGSGGWALRPAEALQRAADTTGTLQDYVVVESVIVDGDRAVVEWGTDLTIPKRDGGGTTVKMCCSIATDDYRKHEGNWIFAKRSKETSF